jgi:hypothetical protein
VKKKTIFSNKKVNENEHKHRENVEIKEIKPCTYA